jgi:DNA polymerase-4
MIAHFDLDCFFVAVERLYDPSLVGKPVAVGGSPEGRGVIASASYEARKFGVRSAQPTATALRLCPQLIVVGGRHGTYRKHSQAFQAVLEEFSPLVEMASVDEAYVDFAGTEKLWGATEHVCRIIVDRVKGECGLDVSVGISTSRTVSKIAGSLAKPQGFAFVPPGNEAAFLAPLKIEEMPGIGPRTAEAMHAAGIHTLGDLAKRPPGDRFAEWAPYAAGAVRGEIYTGDERKSLSCETTFAHDLGAGEDLWHLLREVAEESGRRMRREGLVARTVGVKLKYADFTQQTHARTLGEPTDIDAEIYAASLALAQEKIGARKLRLIGVHLSNLLAADEVVRGQIDLFAPQEDPQRKKQRSLDRTLDKLKNKYGSEGIVRGYQKKDED